MLPLHQSQHTASPLNSFFTRYYRLFYDTSSLSSLIWFFFWLDEIGGILIKKDKCRVCIRLLINELDVSLHWVYIFYSGASSGHIIFTILHLQNSSVLCFGFRLYFRLQFRYCILWFQCHSRLRLKCCSLCFRLPSQGFSRFSPSIYSLLSIEWSLHTPQSHSQD